MANLRYPPYGSLPKFPHRDLLASILLADSRMRHVQSQCLTKVTLTILAKRVLIFLSIVYRHPFLAPAWKMRGNFQK